MSTLRPSHSSLPRVRPGPETARLSLTSATELSLEAIRLVAQSHDQGLEVGVLDAAHLISGGRRNASLRIRSGNPTAPELKRGDMPTQATDVYALGALMYRLLTGAHASGGGPARPSDFNPAVDERLDALVLEALDDDPQRRPASARELERRLLELTGAPERAPLTPPPLPARATSVAPQRVFVAPDREAVVRPPLQRNPLEKPWLVASLGVLVGLLMALLAGLK